MPRTITEKILAQHAGLAEVEPGQLIWKLNPWVEGKDLIIPARRLVTSDPEQLAKHCMESDEANGAGF